MADNPINPPLPADLPEDWAIGQMVAPSGADAGLSEQHGYNYLMKQVNAAQAGVNTLGEAVKSAANGAAPLSHTHGKISNSGAIGTAANKAVFTGANGVLQAGTLPVAAGGTGRNTLTAGAFLRGNGAGAVTMTPAADVAALIGAAAPLAVNTGWKLQYSKTTAGSFTWTAPDLFGGKPYYIGVLVIGGGGSGAACRFATIGAAASGGASGYAISFVIKVTPGTAYSGVVGSGGAAVTASPSVGSTMTGNRGGSSSFNGKTAEGGGGGNPHTGGNPASGAIGGQCSWNATTIGAMWINPYGGVVVNVNPENNYRSAGAPGCCWNPFECKQILGAGGNAGSNTAHLSTGGKDPLAPTQGGGNGGRSEEGNVSGQAGNQPGCGGGAALTYGTQNGSSTTYTATSGKGADGAVMIYVQGVAA